jgi:xanthine dehydrogenase YagR molybdenum-binding subunit
MTTTPVRPAPAPAVPRDPPVPDGDDRPWVGRDMVRRDGTAKATGAARYAADHPVPGLAHGWMVLAPHPRARIRGIDARAALTHPGVVDVVSHLNAVPLRPPGGGPLDLSARVLISRVAYLSTDEVHHEGQPVAVVVAESLEAAQYAAGLVRVDYEVLPSSTDFEASLGRATPVGSSLGPTTNGERGDVEAGLAEAHVTVDLRFTTPAHHHNAIEPHATTAAWDGPRRLTVWDSTQSIDWVRRHLAQRFGLDVRDVRVLAPFVGGGFGGKGHVWPGTLVAAMAARHVGRPVRMALSREAVYRTVGGRTPTRQHVALGADREGRLTAVLHEAVLRTSTSGMFPEQVVGGSGDLYATPAVRLATTQVALDVLPNTAMRAPGEAVGSFALESAVDQLAHDLGLDPLELRRRNEPDVTPLHRRPFSHRRVLEVMDLGAREFDWAGRGPGGRREGDVLVGYGTALAYHPSWLFMAHVRLRLTASGRAVLECGAQEMGMGTTTVLAQVVADELRVTPDDVDVEYGDSDLPLTAGAGGSAQAASITAAVVDAAGRLRRRVGRLGPRPGEDPADTVRRHGADVEVTLGSDFGVRAQLGTVRFFGTFLRDTRRFQRAATGAHFCEVRVDADTGEVRVTRWVSAFDIGRVLNSRTASSQLRGGVVMGLGLALTEESVHDPRTGRVVGPTLADYHVPSHADVPEIAVHVLDDPDPTMPRGVIGAGEVGITGVGAAVANAVFDATGRRPTALPLTPDRVLGLAP